MTANPLPEHTEPQNPSSVEVLPDGEYEQEVTGEQYPEVSDALILDE